MFNNTFKNKKVLITGHTGFKGSWLTLWLLHLGANIVGYALPPKTKKDNYVVLNLSKHIKEYITDIRDKDKVYKVIKNEKPDIIFHLAAQPLVLESFRNPYYTIDTNIIGTLNILEAFRQSNNAILLVVVTTDKVYENINRNIAYKENNKLGGKDPYSASKSSVEIISKAYYESFFKDTQKSIVTVRAGNVIGGGDWSEYRIVPDCIKALEINEKVKIRNPDSIRPWQFVLEPLFGYLMLSKKILEGNREFIGAWNFGPELKNCIKVLNLVKLLIKFYGKGDYSIEKNKKIFIKESDRLVLNISKAKNKLNWKPILELEQAIKFTVDWYLNYKEPNVFDFTLNQIKKYEKLWRLKNLN